MKVITSGFRYLDIDAYGGCIAYAELLNLQGEQAIAASTAPLNESITPTVLSWNAKLARDYQPTPMDEFVLMDLSDPEVFEKFVDQDKIAEIIDHHMEFADYWQQKLGNKANLEFIGAVCTQVYERWQQASKLDQISETSARLLMTGILDNTLNFKATITTERDHMAYVALSQYANLPVDWSAQYFEECQREIMDDLTTAIASDLKIIQFPSLDHKLTTGQLVVWNATDIVTKLLPEVEAAMHSASDEWLMNIVSIEEDQNYLIASDEVIESWVEDLLHAEFKDSIATTDGLWLRKEIMKQDLDRKR